MCHIPAIASVLGTAKLTAPGRQIVVLRRQDEKVWEPSMPAATAR